MSSTKTSIVVFLVVFSIVCSGWAREPFPFIIRVDDIMNRNTTVLPRSIRPFENMVASKGAKVTWAVIPHRLVEKENQNGAVCRELLESLARGHEVSQHGYNHICPICNSTNHEMYCSSRNVAISYAEQETLLVRGMSILQDSLHLKPTSFVPPGHSADQTTFTLLADRGFNVVSTSGPNKIFIKPRLYNLSSHNEFTWAMTAAVYQSKLAQALEDIHSKVARDGYYCLLLHDHFIRQGYENGIVIQWMGELLDSLNVYYRDSIQYMTLSQAALHFATTTTFASKMDYQPESFVLYQNFPNPFKDGTSIVYQLYFPMQVEVGLYNVRGERVRVLYSGMQSAGWHRLWVDRQALAAGCYYYQLRAGEEEFCKRLMILP